MRFKNWALLLSTASAAMFTYGMLYEAKRLVLERRTLRLPGWPEKLAGLKVAVLADLHLRGRYSLDLAQRAVAMAMETNPDVIVLAGDLVDYWMPESEDMIAAALEPLLMVSEKVVAIPGNHDYYYGPYFKRLQSAYAALDIRLLRNEVWRYRGVSWVGLDSAFSPKCDPIGAMAKVDQGPAVCLWHEPDLVCNLPQGCALQISGHSHGGQFRFPFGITPAHSKLGKIYDEGFYPDAPTPLYVSRGVGTTGPPSRFLCPPEVSLLILEPR